jgi:hypothetical protein
MTIRPVGAELFHVDGQTEMTKQIVAFHNFENVPKSDMYLRILAWDKKKMKNSIMAVNMLRMKNCVCVCVWVCVIHIVVDVCIDTLNKCVYEWVLEV